MLIDLADFQELSAQELHSLDLEHADIAPWLTMRSPCFKHQS